MNGYFGRCLVSYVTAQFSSLKTDLCPLWPRLLAPALKLMLGAGQCWLLAPVCFCLPPLMRGHDRDQPSPVRVLISRRDTPPVHIQAVIQAVIQAFMQAVMQAVPMRVSISQSDTPVHNSYFQPIAPSALPLHPALGCHSVTSQLQDE